ncbi:MAG: hypothetical protein A2512_06135 [Deltaproteobacteria bacterium RIFOXYD12_FULL_56_24]|nr:MAG: hypothetical protein A2512_06135 [Deltaproteobacteria bacterium RIFOXYD12_FULL_56_24]
MHPEKKNFLITIDTEGDNLWSRPTEITTENSCFIRRFQDLCERYKLKPTYLTNYEMANAPEFQYFAKDVLSRDVAEIGMHLHAWNTPPYFKLTDNDLFHQPYLIEYPIDVMRDKIVLMTDLLESMFGKKMVSHRAGRWGFDERYARILVENGYKVDCSVTPLISWKGCIGDPVQSGGNDYTNFHKDTYFINLNDISKKGMSSLLEVPVSIEKLYFSCIDDFKNTFQNIPPIRKPLNYLFPTLTWLRPDGSNLRHMLNLLKKTVHLNKDYVEFVLHSSELMPGGSPNFVSKKAIDKLYEDMEILFSKTLNHYVGCTLNEYYEKYILKKAIDVEDNLIK